MNDQIPLARGTIDPPNARPGRHARSWPLERERGTTAWAINYRSTGQQGLADAGYLGFRERRAGMAPSLAHVAPLTVRTAALGVARGQPQALRRSWSRFDLVHCGQ
ncbi:MAG: hypothetical protein ACE5HT_16675 [Gemmatimonadales bacterium]